MSASWPNTCRDLTLPTGSDSSSLAWAVNPQQSPCNTPSASPPVAFQTRTLCSGTPSSPPLLSYNYSLPESTLRFPHLSGYCPRFRAPLRSHAFRDAGLAVHGPFPGLRILTGLAYRAPEMLPHCQHLCLTHPLPSPLQPPSMREL